MHNGRKRERSALCSPRRWQRSATDLPGDAGLRTELPTHCSESQVEGSLQAVDLEFIFGFCYGAFVRRCRRVYNV